MILTDGAGRVVATRAAGAGGTAGGDPVLLLPGSYQVPFSAEAPAGGQPPPIAFRLYGASLSDPIGPQLDNSLFKTLAGSSSPGRSASPAGIGGGDAPYTWLALSLSSPRGPSFAVPTPEVGGAISRQLASRVASDPTFLRRRMVPARRGRSTSSIREATPGLVATRRRSR